MMPVIFVFKSQRGIARRRRNVWQSGPASKFLKGKLPNFTDKAVMAKIKDEEILDTVTNGVKTEVGTMPAFKAKLKPEEIQDVINFVHSLAK